MKIAAVSLAVIMSAVLWKILYTAESKAVILKSIKSGMQGMQSGRLPGWLEKSGLAEKLSPGAYRLYQCICFLAGFACALLFAAPVWFCLVSGLAGILVPGMVIKAHIKKENKKMMPDIEHLYHLLHLQKQAGAFFLDSLTDSYRVVTYWRLKKALIDMTGALHNKKSVQEATEEFAQKFDNLYITSLAEIIRHGVEDGNTESMLQDVSEQIGGIQQALYIEEEGRQQMESIFIFTLLFIGIVGGVILLGAGALTQSNSLFIS